MQYTARGAVSVMKLGNDLREHTDFNSRLQPNQIGLGTSQSPNSLLALDYGYVISGQLDPTKNNGNYDHAEIVVDEATTGMLLGAIVEDVALLQCSEAVN